MSKITLRYEYGFHAVGQGLFSSGRLSWMRKPYQKIHESNAFRWVFDCGQHPGNSNVQREVRQYRAFEGLGSAIDRRIHLVCISHFDEDHINGFQHLLHEVDVETLVLPYYPLLDRLVLLLATDSPPTASEIRYVIDPIGSLIADAGEKAPKSIVLIKSTRPEEAQDGVEEGGARENESEELFLKAIGQPLSAIERAAFGGMVEDEELSDITVGILDHDKSMTISQLWEFIFYNEYFPDIQCATLVQLRSEVDHLIDTRFTGGVIDDPDAFVRDLQKIYDKHLGDNSVQRNRISLWMYAGPIGAWRAWFRSEERALNHSITTRHGWGPYIETPEGICNHKWHSKQQGAAMYTGDCDISDPTRFQTALQHFQPRRIRRTGLLQVPHHGADGNWHPDAAASWPPLHAVISARTGNLHHPGTMVMNDLAVHGHCSLRANEVQRVLTRGGVAWDI